MHWVWCLLQSRVAITISQYQIDSILQALMRRTDVYNISAQLMAPCISSDERFMSILAAYGVWVQFWLWLVSSSCSDWFWVSKCNIGPIYFACTPLCTKQFITWWSTWWIMGLEEFLIQMHNISVVIAIMFNIIAFIIGIGLIKQIIEIILVYVIMSIVRQ